MTAKFSSQKFYSYPHNHSTIPVHHCNRFMQNPGPQNEPGRQMTKVRSDRMTKTNSLHLK